MLPWEGKTTERYLEELGHFVASFQTAFQIQLISYYPTLSL